MFDKCIGTDYKGLIMPRLKYFLEATRPKTLPASATPVLVGSSLAYLYGSFDSLNFFLILVCAVCIQIITNFVNEIYDSKKGADNAERVGPRRMVALGHISASEMKTASIALAAATLAIGLAVVGRTDLNVLWIGLASLFFGWLYTGGPYPLAYKGLGDVFVFIFFGLVAVSGSFYVHSGELTTTAILASLAPGFLITNILGVNNYRDIETDTRAGKRTLTVILGRKRALILFDAMLVGAYAAPLALCYDLNSLLPIVSLASLPFGVRLARKMRSKSGAELNPVLADAGKLVFIHGLLSSLGFILLKAL